MSADLRRDVVALYVDARSVYSKLVAEWYDQARDARMYAGDLPVVAHPPCGPWSKLRHLYQGTEHDCGPSAVEVVRRVGGVLEQPKDSKLWEKCDLPAPGDWPDEFGGFSLQVDQVAWGHVARKSTWLYFVGVGRRAVESLVFTGGVPTHWVSGFRSSKKDYPARYKRTGCAVPPGIKVCSAEQRRRTPRAFAEWLVAAATARRA